MFFFKFPISLSPDEEPSPFISLFNRVQDVKKMLNNVIDLFLGTKNYTYFVLIYKFAPGHRMIQRYIESHNVEFSECRREIVDTGPKRA